LRCKLSSVIRSFSTDQQLKQQLTLKLFVAATGYNNVDLEAAAEHEIAVCNVRNYTLCGTTRFLLMLSLIRHLSITRISKTRCNPVNFFVRWIFLFKG
jgi:lactate dehydrogenase-like 2-hydroxyacid dehydrogenase